MQNACSQHWTCQKMMRRSEGELGKDSVDGGRPVWSKLSLLCRGAATLVYRKRLLVGAVDLQALDFIGIWIVCPIGLPTMTALLQTTRITNPFSRAKFYSLPHANSRTYSWDDGWFSTLGATLSLRKRHVRPPRFVISPRQLRIFQKVASILVDWLIRFAVLYLVDLD